MADIDRVASVSGLFFAVLGLLFSTWYEDLNRVVSSIVPPMYRNRRKYIHDLQASILSKSIPLNLFILSYVVALSSSLIRVASTSGLTTHISEVDPVITLFTLSYFIALYLLALSMVLLVQLIARWWQSANGRDPSQPRVTTFR